MGSFFKNECSNSTAEHWKLKDFQCKKKITASQYQEDRKMVPVKNRADRLYEKPCFMRRCKTVDYSCRNISSVWKLFKLICCRNISQVKNDKLFKEKSVL